MFFCINSQDPVAIFTGNMEKSFEEEEEDILV